MSVAKTQTILLLAAALLFGSVSLSMAAILIPSNP